jgi:hypothetical protein
MTAEKRERLRAVVLDAIRRGDNPWNAAWNVYPLFYDRHLVSDILFALWEEKLIIYDLDRGYRMK